MNKIDPNSFVTFKTEYIKYNHTVDKMMATNQEITVSWKDIVSIEESNWHDSMIKDRYIDVYRTFMPSGRRKITRYVLNAIEYDKLKEKAKYANVDIDVEVERVKVKSAISLLEVCDEV